MRSDQNSTRVSALKVVCAELHHSRGAITVITDPLVDHQTLYSNLVIAVDMKAFSALLQKLEISQFPGSPVLILPIFKLLTPLFCFVNTKPAPLFNLFFSLKSKWKILPLLVYLVYLGTFFTCVMFKAQVVSLGPTAMERNIKITLFFSFYPLFSPAFFFPTEYKKSCSDSEKQRALENKVNHCGRMPEVDKWRKWVLAQDQLFVFLVGNFSSFGLHFYLSSSLNLSASFHSFLAPTSFFSIQALPPSARHLNPAVLLSLSSSPLPLDFPRFSPADCIVQVLHKPNKRGDRSAVYRNSAVLMNRISQSSCSGFFFLWPQLHSRSSISHEELDSRFTDSATQMI